MADISIIGSGVVGRGVAAGLVADNKIIFHDIDQNTVRTLAAAGKTATTDLQYAIANSELSFLAVPTPTTDGKIRLEAIDAATKALSDVLQQLDRYHVFCIKSTITPGTTERLVIPNLEASGKRCGHDFGVVYNPEFLTEISASWTEDTAFKKDIFSEDKIVVGEGPERRAGDAVVSLYQHLKTPVFRTDYRTAEFIKYAANCCLAARISYWNEIGLIAAGLGIDSQKVADIVSMDKRIGKYGTVHGKAFGGKCLPKDLDAFIDYVEGNCSHKPLFLKATRDVNNEVRRARGVRE